MDDELRQERGRDLLSQTPNCHFLTIAKHGVDIYCAERKNLNLDIPSEGKMADISSETELELKKIATWNYSGAEVAEWSPLGNLLGIGTSTGLVLIDPNQAFKVIGEIQTGCVKKLYFSPKGTYAVIMTQFTASNEKNVKVYKTSDLSMVTSFSMKAVATQERWPSLMWSDNETYCLRMMTNEVQIYPSDLTNFPLPSTRVPAEKIRSFAPSIEYNDGMINVATFSPPSNDRPASIKIFLVASLSSKAVAVKEKSFFQVQDVTFKWNNSATAVLAVAHTDVDNSGKSYYGTSSLYYIEAEKNGQTAQLIGGDKGPVSDFDWSPTANEFIVISGPIPPSISLYDGKTGDAKLSFGQSRRNTIRFNPFGRFILLAGFGNLAGDFDVWDKNKRKVIGSGKAQCSVECEWAPNGRVFLCATTAPRMRVDNGVKIYRYNGDLLANIDIPELYSVKWLPCLPGTHPDRGVSRGRLIGAAVQPAEPPKLYRPPKATEAFDARMKAQRCLNVAQTTATVVKSTNLPPGAEFVQPMSKSAKKNAAKKAKKKKEAAGLP